jgi:hypothetical protein
MILRSITRAVGVVLLVDGISALISPTNYLRKLETGTPLIDDLLDYCAENPDITRGFALLEASLGAWLTLS